ncbi:MAG: tryptophan-rich sensory protein [Verrucomicrobia bacterium]|jgi:translocator protein|nr:tryptophan-rich sensory protein [Verrucomicrobiota bacterium]
METPASRGSVVTLVGLLVLTLGLGGLGSLATVPQIPTWYAQLQKPAFNPPNWIFGPVWTTLYVLMAVSLWRVWRSGHADALKTKITFILMLVLNAAWSPVFFRLHRPDLALWIIYFYVGSLALLIRYLWRQDRLAAALQLPHLAWVLFATALNSAIAHLNQ